MFDLRHCFALFSISGLSLYPGRCSPTHEATMTILFSAAVELKASPVFAIRH